MNEIELRIANKLFPDRFRLFVFDIKWININGEWMWVFNENLLLGGIK
ncbi:MAG: hypothetical protein AABY22_32960 [Nanoarchaeota archaeon]